MVSQHSRHTAKSKIEIKTNIKKRKKKKRQTNPKQP
jgi:hypothetical protein